MASILLVAWSLLLLWLPLLLCGSEAPHETTLQIPATNLIKQGAAHFEPVMNANYRLVAQPPTRRTAVGGSQMFPLLHAG